MDFGIEFTGKTGRVIGVLAEVGGTAGIVVHLTWRGGKGPAPGMSEQRLRQLLRTAWSRSTAPTAARRQRFFVAPVTCSPALTW